ncbi:C25 family peptidase propeptide domain-containing protein, partial [candidate division CSSED10-310 bacterium]
MMNGLQRTRGQNSLWAVITMLLLGVAILIGSPLMVAAADAVQIGVVEDSGKSIVLDYTFDNFTEQKVQIRGQIYKRIKLGQESLMREKIGAPELPQVNRSIIIPNDAMMEVKMVNCDYYEIRDIDIAPSRGFILRNVNPKNVPYSFGRQYQNDAFYPAQPFSMSKPYILRDYRGLVVKVYPFQYNPVQRVLRVYTYMTVEVVKTRAGEVNVKNRPFRPDDVSQAFQKIYRN